MRGLLEESLEQGAWGFSTGLEYAAERAASPDELGSLCAVCARSGGLYATHTRYRDVGSEDAVDEAIETAERAGVRLQVSHLVPRNGIDATRACIDRVERAAGRGLDIAFDMHTRLFGTTFLSTAVPPAFLRSDRIGSRRPAPRRRRGDGVVHEHPQRRRRLVAHRPSRQRPVAGVRPARPRLDRRRPAADASRGDLRPPRGGARRARDADGDHPLLHGGPAGGGVPPPALRARLRRDDPRARRAARDVLLPRRVHVGRLVPPLHGSRARAALARGGGQAPDERSGGAGRPTRPRRAPRGRVRRRRRLRLGRGARDAGRRSSRTGWRPASATCSSTASRR